MFFCPKRVLIALLVSLIWALQIGAAENRPNIVLVITDDQGFGDLGCNGNDKIKTPNIDAFSKQGAVLQNFFVCPVCAPTRASLLTGRYNYRTGAIDTYCGRAIMHPDEITLAEVLRDAGYATGIFGKWHLGDSYPTRPMDQGFQETFVHGSGGIGQPGDAPGNTYFSPLIQHNGKPEKTNGYCTDVFFSAALSFIEKHRAKPFFAYIATNAPHEPLQVDEKRAEPYLKMGLDEKTAKIYAMVENIDENVGKLLERLRALNLEQNTIVIFMTDNGPYGVRYNANMRGMKGTIYDGGIHVPFFVRWPAKIGAGTRLAPMAAHIDVFPTLLEACGVKPPAVKIDGMSLLPLLTGAAKELPDRTLFFQWHRGDEPILFKDCAARSQKYKLVNGKELYDLEADPAEAKNVAAEKPDIAAKLRAEYEAWFKDVSSTRGYAPIQIWLGDEHENPVSLTRQDWRGPLASWGPKALGYWEVDVRRAGTYTITVRFPAGTKTRSAHFKLGTSEASTTLEAGVRTIVFKKVALGKGEGRLEAWSEDDEKKSAGAIDVEVRAE